MTQIKLCDTTLRDGAQQEGISFSVADKLKIVQKLDEFGIHILRVVGQAVIPKIQSSSSKRRT